MSVTWIADPRFSRVAHLLDGKARRRKQPPPLDVVVPESVRHVRVTPHPLADYDSLSKKDGES